MENINRMLTAMVREGLISHEVQLFLQKFFMSRMCLKSDIKEQDVAHIIKEMAITKFGSELSLNADFLTGDFKKMYPKLIAEAALGESISSLDLEKIFFVFCQVHDDTTAKN
ncbi:MAG: hypothetical protein WCV70_00760 [Patescibacteria group bacterium]|jgi:hypothetical protein